MMLLPMWRKESVAKINLPCMCFRCYTEKKALLYVLLPCVDIKLQVLVQLLCNQIFFFFFLLLNKGTITLSSKHSNKKLLIFWDKKILHPISLSVLNICHSWEKGYVYMSVYKNLTSIALLYGLKQIQYLEQKFRPCY